MPDWFSELVAVAPWLAAIVATVLAVRKAWPVLRKVNHLVDDLLGEAARPGVPARPGIVEDMSLLRKDMAEQRADMTVMRSDIDKVKQQVKNSHSTNLRDDVDSVMTNVTGLHDKLDGLQTPPIQTTITVNPGGTP